MSPSEPDWRHFDPREAPSGGLIARNAQRSRLNDLQTLDFDQRTPEGSRSVVLRDATRASRRRSKRKQAERRQLETMRTEHDQELRPRDQLDLDPPPE